MYRVSPTGVTKAIILGVSMTDATTSTETPSLPVIGEDGLVMDWRRKDLTTHLGLSKNTGDTFRYSYLGNEFKIDPETNMEELFHNLTRWEDQSFMTFVLGANAEEDTKQLEEVKAYSYAWLRENDWEKNLDSLKTVDWLPACLVQFVEALRTQYHDLLEKQHGFRFVRELAPTQAAMVVLKERLPEHHEPCRFITDLLLFVRRIGTVLMIATEPASQRGLLRDVAVARS